MSPAFGMLPTIVEAAVSESNVDLAAGNRCISIGHKTPVSNGTLFALRQAGVGYISTRSVGCNHLDMDYAARLGIAVENVAYSPDSVADYTVMLILMALRNAQILLRRVDMHDYRLDGLQGKELRDLTVGVVGAGRIGAAVTDRLLGFGCRVLTHDSRVTTGPNQVGLDALLCRSDVVSLHVPLTADTYHLLDGRRIDQMKDGAILVNTARGALVDTKALLFALKEGRVGGAALDVVEGEEGVFYSDCSRKPMSCTPLLALQNLPNVIVSPHCAYYTDHALSDMVRNSLANCADFEHRSQHG